MMSFDIYNNRVPYKLLTKEEQEALKAAKYGWEWYWFGEDCWEKAINLNDSHVRVYRALPPPPVCYATFDWSGIDEKYRWQSTDLNGMTCVWINKPFPGVSVWHGGHRYRVDGFLSSYKAGNVPWDKSCIRRPQ